jgi:hypothetical protein
MNTMTSLGGATEWLDAEPFGPAGRVVNTWAVPEEVEGLR